MDELADLFQARSRFVEALAEEETRSAAPARCSPASRGGAGRGARAPSAHRRAPNLSGRSAAEQGADARIPAVLAELAELNAAYEERFGFRFVVFVNRRPRAEIVPVLRERLERTRAEELETGCDELVAIAVDRWRSS